MGNIKFSTIGDKLKRYRKKYGIKLTSFEKYGFSPSYISMIENNKRMPPLKTLKDIYQSLVELTQNEIVNEISVEEFLLDEKDQAQIWINENLTLEIAILNYEELVMICNQYGFNHQLLCLEELLAFHYREQKEYSKSTLHFFNCLLYSNKAAIYYIEIGRNYRQFGMYQEAVINLQLALKMSDDDDLINRVNEELALTYYYLGDFENCNLYIEQLNNSNIESKRSIALILTSAVLEKQGRLKEGRQILEDYLKHSTYSHHLNYVYHALGNLLIIQEDYVQALKILEEGMAHRKTKIEKGMSKFLIGKANYLMGNAEESYNCYKEIQSIILKQGEDEDKKQLIESSLQVYFQLNHSESVECLIQEVQQLKHQEIEVYLKINIYKQLRISGVIPSSFIKNYIISL